MRASQTKPQTPDTKLRTKAAIMRDLTASSMSVGESQNNEA